MKDKTCYVVGAGENYELDFQPTAEDFVIAADAGLCYLDKQGIRADILNADYPVCVFCHNRYNDAHSKYAMCGKCL